MNSYKNNIYFFLYNFSSYACFKGALLPANTDLEIHLELTVLDCSYKDTKVMLD